MTRIVLKTLNLSLVGCLSLHQNDIRALKERKIAKYIYMTLPPGFSAKLRAHMLRSLYFWGKVLTSN